MDTNLPFRLILDPPRNATLNMAIDEMLMELQQQSSAVSTLRFYSWNEPSYSLGYFQNLKETAVRFRCREKKIPVVRRITGGGMVIHGEDLTFSLSLKNPSSFLPNDTKSSYLKINEAVIAGFKNAYPVIDYADCHAVPSGRPPKDRERICFESPSCYDVLLGGKKVVGASQRRSRGALLHQSSVFINEPKETLIQKILDGFRRRWNIEFKEMPLTDEEIGLAGKKERERFSSDLWVFPALG